MDYNSYALLLKQRLFDKVVPVDPRVAVLPALATGQDRAGQLCRRPRRHDRHRQPKLPLKPQQRRHRQQRQWDWRHAAAAATATKQRRGDGDSWRRQRQ